MQNKPKYGRLYSASDLVAYLGCHHRTELDLKRLNGWDKKPKDADDATQLIQNYGDRHEREYLQELIQSGLSVVQIDKDAPLEIQLQRTDEALRSGADVIFQATLIQPPFIGYADFFIKVPGQSKLGDYHYEVIDTKLAKSSRGKFVMQLCLYAEMLAEIQGVMPKRLHIVLGKLDPEEARLKGLDPNRSNTTELQTRDYYDYFKVTKKHFLNYIAKLEQHPPTVATLPERVKACDLCGWADHCSSYWSETDHLSQVAGIRKDQIIKLNSSGVHTMKALSQLNTFIPGISNTVLDKIKKQAELQVTRTTAEGTKRIEYIEPSPTKATGFALLPEPNEGDLYFDMEGFPYEVGGLEYLFGVGWRDPANPVHKDDPIQVSFTPFWAHSRKEEKKAFEDFMDHVQAHLKKYPNAHIYHYAPYEKTAIQRLSSIHNTRTEFRDQLLREGRLIDLYRVVASGLQLALPSYSIKYVETYYRKPREGDVVNAGASIVEYEKFRNCESQEVRNHILEAIQKYNEDDVDSTWRLHVWLEQIRKSDIPYFVKEVEPVREESQDAPHLLSEQQIDTWLFAQPESRKVKATAVAELLKLILSFYWRAKLPSLWRMFQKQELDEIELIEDRECLALLEYTGNSEKVANSIRYYFSVPEQESKLSTGSNVKCLTDNLAASNFEINEEEGICSFTRSSRSPAPPHIVSLAINDDVPTKSKQDSIVRFITSLAENPTQSNPRLDILMQEFPRLLNKQAGSSVVDIANTEQLTSAIENLQNSYLVIQGPPGTGKTFSASKAITHLLKAGKKVAVTSNSHAAINNLLIATHKELNAVGLSKVIAATRADESLPQGIQVCSSRELNSNIHDLSGGTAWAYCVEEQTAQWDYLFIDEASQVSLADLLAAGSCAKNIILLGDQMQLSQPVQGTHPGKSGLSSLDYLMNDHATVPSDRGIFLEHTYRMHPEICKPISKGVYEDRLESNPDCAVQKIILNEHAHSALKPFGISYVPVLHQGRSQASTEEAKTIKAVYESLLQQKWMNKYGEIQPITENDILIVAPYNAQRIELRKELGTLARIGTVDKFQGQEAAVAIFSMTSSDRENIPRGLDFLFSKNRLNVALSRAKCLALLVASPELEQIECDKVDDMRLLNFYTQIIDASSGH